MSQHLFLLHGALGSKEQLKALPSNLKGSYVIHRFNFIGHGGLAIPAQMLMGKFVEQLKEYVLENIPVKESVSFFGYSMGGYAALLFAAENKEIKIDRIITLGTKLFWNEEVAQKEILMLNPQIIEEKIPAFAKDLERRHHPADWKLLLKKTAEMMEDLGHNQYLNDKILSKIEVPCKLMLGDRDKMVSLEETLNAFKQLKNGSLSILPSTPHPIEKVNLSRLVFELEN